MAQLFRNLLMRVSNPWVERDSMCRVLGFECSHTETRDDD